MVAKNALLFPNISSSHLPTNSDLFLFINKFIHVSWVPHSEKQSHNILAELMRSSHPWNLSNQPYRHLEITRTRLRIGHTRLTHTQLLTHLMPLACPHCGLDPPLSIEHIFKCPELSAIFINFDYNSMIHNLCILLGLRWLRSFSKTTFQNDLT